MTTSDPDDNTVHVDVAASEPRPDWCDTCLKPAALTWDLFELADDGISLISEISGCPDCGTGVFSDDDPT